MEDGYFGKGCVFCVMNCGLYDGLLVDEYGVCIFDEDVKFWVGYIFCF